MELVKDAAQITNNLLALERLRARPNDAAFLAYAQLIKRGTCFYPYQIEGGLAFAPSRFIGYRSNSIEQHLSNSGKDGRITNKALSQIIGAQPEVNRGLEARYQAFCGRLGFSPSQTGTFGVTRKYWVTTEAQEALEQAACDAIRVDPTLTPTEKDELIKARIGQGQFRQCLVKYWNGCAVTSCAVIGILRASHIKPWRDATNAERLDPFNGLLLSPNLDALFDRAMITFAANGKILISAKLGALDRRKLGLSDELSIAVSPKHEHYLHHHRARFHANDRD